MRPGLKREFEFAFKSHLEICSQLASSRSRRVNGSEIACSKKDGETFDYNKKSKVNEFKGKHQKVITCFKDNVVMVNYDEKDLLCNKKASNHEGVNNLIRSMSPIRAENGSDDVNYILASNKVVDIEKKNIGEISSLSKNLDVGKSQQCQENTSISKSIQNKDLKMTMERMKNNDANDSYLRRVVKRFDGNSFCEETNDQYKCILPKENTSDFAKDKKVSKDRKFLEENKFPTNLKDLLSSGILEGLNVKYLSSSKGKTSPITKLEGVIEGKGILCFCQSCKGEKVVAPTIFELHAGSANKRPPEYIALQNGNTMRYVMNACKNASFETLDKVLEISIGCTLLKKSKFCLNCRDSISKVEITRSMILCNSCMKCKDSQVGSTQSINSIDSIKISKSTDDILKCATKAKNKMRLTRKDISLRRLLFSEDVLPNGTNVSYISQGKVCLTGHKQGGALFCNCCSFQLSPSQFEAHAGYASRKNPYMHIYTSDRVSLHELAINLHKDRKILTKESDDFCQICNNDGNLLHCDGCKKNFHQECGDLSKNFEDSWHCKKCNTVEHDVNSISLEKVGAIDKVEDIVDQCIQIFKNFEPDFGGCELCGQFDFDKCSGDRTILICDQCEKEFHFSCVRDVSNLKEIPEGKWFCSIECDIIHSTLEKIVLQGEELLQSYASKKHKKSDPKQDGVANIKWRLLNKQLDSRNECDSLLAEVISIFHEQFRPIMHTTTDTKSTHDLIPLMVYGNTIDGMNFGGMYCVVLTVNNIVASAALLRIFGSELAELPLVATRRKFQGQGFFQSLFMFIEQLLWTLNVKNLILPAAKNTKSSWMKKFGFERITHDEVISFQKKYPIREFSGTLILRKSAFKDHSIDTS